ncbi:unnamed protein product [Spodoptera exigua]|nr:unnamed protein product [Spodoptera exigua]
MFITEKNKIKLNAFICHVDNEVMEKYHLLVTGSCYLVTCFFVILRLSLIAWLPELRTLHGVIIIAYLANFIVGYFLTAIKKLFMSEHSISRDLCVALNFMIYFWILSAFFWRNVMCFDMWSTFSGKRVLTRGNTIPRLRFGAYFAYAFGVPAVLTIILAAMEYSKISNFHPLKPKLRLNGCAGISGIGSLIYYFTPLIILFFMNIAMFTSTALKIEATKKQTKILFQSENNVVNALNTERQRFLLYLKLWAAMLIMEVNWIVKAVVYVFPSIHLLAFIVDVSNSVILLMLMIQYFCQKSTWKKVKKKYRQMRGLPQSEQNTATSSNRTMSISSVEGQQAYCNSVTSNYEMHPK